MSQSSRCILQLFREQGGFVSGETVSRVLQVSRSAVWKQINGLRRAGYVIEAVPSRGYRLVSAPDLLTEEAVSSLMSVRCIGRQLVCHPVTVSTNADAFRLAEQGAGEGTVVVADSQSGGKGRRGRVWASPPETNLYCSIILRPEIMPWEAPQLTFLSVVAVVRAIAATTGLQAQIKWPNDVLLNGRKVAGLLNEMSAETDGVTFVVLGIGVNLNMQPDQFPADLRYPATSLALETGRPVVRSLFAATLLQELDRLYSEFVAEGFEPVRTAWQQGCSACGREVVVSDGARELARGICTGIDRDGALLLQRVDGSVERILSGDVRVL